MGWILIYVTIRFLQAVQEKRNLARLEEMEEDIKEERMNNLRKIANLDLGVREEMDKDGDGNVSFEEFKAYMEKKTTQKEKLKAIGVYLGDKVIDLAVVSLAVVSMYFFGISII